MPIDSTKVPAVMSGIRNKLYDAVNILLGIYTPVLIRDRTLKILCKIHLVIFPLGIMIRQFFLIYKEGIYHGFSFPLKVTCALNDGYIYIVNVIITMKSFCCDSDLKRFTTNLDMIQEENKNDPRNELIFRILITTRFILCVAKIIYLCSTYVVR